MDDYSVKVYIYDLSKGLARSMSMGFLGKQIDGIWHTGIVVFGQEFFFGGGGIESCAPGCLGIGQPDSVVEVGKSQIPFEVFMDYLQDLSTSTFKPECYHLLDHNCNTFSNEIASFLTGNGIPSHITSLPQDVLSTPFGAMLKPFIDSMMVSPPGGHAVFPIGPQNAGTSGAASSASSTPKLEEKKEQSTDQDKAKALETPKMTPKTFTNKEVLKEYKSAREELIKQLSTGDIKLLDEIFEYLSIEECTWGLGRQHLKILGEAISRPALDETNKGAVTSLLQLTLGKDDTVPLITHDPEHTISKLINKFDQLPALVQYRLIKGLCNLSTISTGLTFLNTKDEIVLEENKESNLNSCLRIFTASLLSDDADVSSAGVCLTYSFMSQRVETGDDSAVDVGSAAIQLFQNKLSRETAGYLLEILLKCMELNSQVCGIAAVMGLNLDRISSEFPDLAERCSFVKNKIEESLG